MQPANHPQESHGSALITALFIMTLIAIAATAMSNRLQLDIYQTKMSIQSDTLYLASESVTFWAMDTLSSPKNRFSKPLKTNLIALFPKAQATTYPQVTLTGKLYDLQALFNINNLQDKKYHPVFLTLLTQIAPKMAQKERRQLLDSIVYWISPYQPERGHDEGLSYYMEQIPPYLPAYQSLQSLSELRLIHGVTETIYQTLEPYLTALPEVTPVNINTSPKRLIQSLGEGISDTQFDELLEARGDTGIRTLKKLYEILPKLRIPLEDVSIDSTYFLCIATARGSDLETTTYTIIKRSNDRKGHISIGIVRQSLNTW